MTHLLPLFGHDDETRMREKRLIMNTGPENAQPNPEQQIAALQKENELLRTKLEKMEQAQETTNKLLEIIAAKLSAPDVPRQSESGTVTIPSVLHRGHNRPRVQRMMQREVANHYRGGFPMPQRATHILQRYPQPYAGRRFDPLPNAAKLRRFYNHNPTATHFRQTYKSQGTIPDSVHWTEAAVAHHIANSDGTAYKTSPDGTYIHKDVREQKKKVSSSDMAGYHESRLRREIFGNEKYEHLRGNPAAEEAFEQYQEMMSRPGSTDRRVRYNHIALLRTRLDTINKMYKAEKEYGEKPFNNSGVIEHIYLGDDRDRRVMITTPKDEYGVSETIKLSPSKRSIFGGTADAAKMKDWNITYKVKRRNTEGPTHYDAVGISLSFSKPGTYIVDGRTVVVEDAGDGTVKNAEQSRRVENALLRTPAIVSKTRSRMTKLYVTKNGSEAYTEIYVDNMEAGEGRDGSNGVTAFRDENGEIHLAFFEAGSYQVLGRFIGGQQEALGTFTVKGKLSPEKKQPRPDPSQEKKEKPRTTPEVKPPSNPNFGSKVIDLTPWSDEKLQNWLETQESLAAGKLNTKEEDIKIEGEEWVLGTTTFKLPVTKNGPTFEYEHFIYKKDDPYTMARLPFGSDTKDESVLKQNRQNAMSRRLIEKENKADMNDSFELENTDMAYLNFYDGEDENLKNMAKTMEGLPQILQKRYNLKEATSEDLSMGDPIVIMRQSIWNQVHQGRKNIYMSIFTHGNPNELGLVDRSVPLIPINNFLNLLKEFPECTFNVDGIWCFGAGTEQALTTFKDKEGTKDGRIHIYTQTKPDVTNHSKYDILGNTTTSYNGFLVKYLAQGVPGTGVPGEIISHGEARRLADLEAKKVSKFDASSFTSRGSNRIPDHTADNSPNASENAA